MGNVLLEINEQDRVAVVTLNKQPLNICDRHFYREIKGAFDEINLTDSVSVVILKSDCKHFCAGGDLAEIQSCSTQDKVNVISGAAADCMGAIYSCRYPVIAAVHGKAIGAGLALAACSDVIIASDDAKFSLPEITAGYIGASEFLEMIMPRRLARYYVFTGDVMSAQQMKEWGSVLDVVPGDNLMERSMEVARKIAAQSPLALSYFKKCMNYNDNEELRDKYFNGAKYTVMYNASEDCKETFLAFKEKRQPKFYGK